MKKYVHYKNFSENDIVKINYINGKSVIGKMKRIIVDRSDFGVTEVMEVLIPETEAIVRAPIDRVEGV